MVQWASLGSKAAAPILLALLIGGCPKRQTAPRVVYVQAPPPSSATTAKAAGNASSETLTIEEPSPQPPPPEPAAASEPAVTLPLPSAAPRRTRARTDSHEGEGNLTPAETAEPAQAPEPAPQLEPLSNGSPENETRELQAQQERMAARIAELKKNPSLGESDRRTLRDADAFVSQSQEALRDRNLLRARELANKASQLLSAITPAR